VERPPRCAVCDAGATGRLDGVPWCGGAACRRALAALERQARIERGQAIRARAERVSRHAYLLKQPRPD
jgi:hypothetical protein